MKNLFWRTAAALLVLSITGSPLPAHRLQSLDKNGGRIPNTDPKQMFPRWLPLVEIDAAFFPGENTPLDITSTFQNPRLAVDARNVVHVVGSNSSGLFYYSTDFAGRARASGFSAALNLDPTAGNANADIAVGPNGDLHVIYSKGTGSSVSTLQYLQRTSAGWQTPVVLDTTNYPNYFDLPRVAVGPSNSAHTIALFGNAVFGGTLYLVHGTSGSPGTAQISGTSSSTLGYALAIDSANNSNVVWVDQGDTAKYNQQSGAGWLSATGIAIATGQEFGLKADLAVDWSDGNAVHFSWSDGTGVRYRKGTTGPIENVSLGSGAHPHIAVDSRHQPHIIWTSSGALSYAGRINNPAIGPDPWAGRQEPTELSAVGPRQTCDPAGLAVDSNDGLYVVGTSASSDAVFTRTVEYNLGAQDPYAMRGVGPNAAVNLTNGNLLMTVPLFGSQGAGLSTTFALIYNSQKLDGQDGMISRGWSHSYHMYLIDSELGWKNKIQSSSFGGPNADVITLFMPDGRGIAFNWKITDPSDPSSGYHVAYDEFGYFARIERQDVSPGFAMGYLMTTKYGVKYFFGVDGKLESIMDENGNPMALNYTNGLLTQILDTMGRSTAIAYPPGSGRIDTITDPAGTTYKLAYDSASRLNKVTINAGGKASEMPIWQMTYYGADDAPSGGRANLLSTATTPRGNVQQYFYYLDNRFQASQDPALSPATFDSVDEQDPGSASISLNPPRRVDYFDPGNPALPPVDEPRAEFTDRRGFVWKSVYEQRKGLVDKAVDPSGAFVQRIFSSDVRNLKEFRDKESNQTLYTYTQESGTKEKPLYVRDNLRNVTAPDANAPSGGVLGTITTVQYAYYDGQSRVQSRTVPNPASPGSTVTTTYTYDSNGNLQTITPPATSNRVTGVPQSIQYTINYVSSAPLGRVDNTVAPEGGVTQFLQYDSATGLPSSIKLPDHDKAYALEYDTMGNLTHLTTPENTIAQLPTIFTLDGLYRVHTRTDPPGDAGTAITTYTYDLDSNVSQVDYPNGGQTVHTYDQLDRRVQTTIRKDSGTTLILLSQYDPEGNLRISTDPLQNKSYLLYSGRGDLVKSTRSAAPSPDIVTTYVPTTNGDLQSRTTAGDMTSYIYTGRRTVLTMTYPQVGPDTFSAKCVYDDAGNLTKLTGLFNEVFKYGTFASLDELGRVFAQTQLSTDVGDPSDPQTFFGFDRDGNRTNLKDPEGRAFANTFDQADRSRTVQNAALTTVTNTNYDDNDRPILIQVLDPVSGSGLVTASSRSYTPRDEIKTEQDIFGNQTTYNYLIGGELDTRTDPQGVVTKSIYNFLSQPISVTENFGGSNTIFTQFGYDNNLNRNQVTDPRGNQSTYLYDAAGHLKSLTYPGGTNSESWSYDTKGRLASHTDHRGVVGTFLYDSLDRLTNETYMNGAQTLANILRAYDGASNPLETLDTVTKVSHRNTKADGTPGFDTQNRLTDSRILTDVTELGGAGTPWSSIGYTYRMDSQIDKFTDPSGQVFQYGYDTEGRLGTITRITPTPNRTYVTYGYDGAGRRTSALLQTGSEIFWQHDQKGRIKNVRTMSSASATIASFTYTYNGRDERTHVQYDHMNVGVDFAYDPFSRLKSEAWLGGASKVADFWGIYNYDTAGNRSFRQTNKQASTASYDSENRITQELEAPLQKLTPISVTVSSSAAGYTAAPITDGATSNGTTSTVAWESDVAPLPHQAVLSYGTTPVSVSQIVLYFPSTRLSQAFQVQYWNGTDWIDFPTEVTIGAKADTSVYQATNRHVILGTSQAPSTTQIRFLQGTGGGSTQEPGVAYLNEMDCYADGNAAKITYSYKIGTNAGLSPNILQRKKGSTIETYDYDYANRLSQFTLATGTTTSAADTYGYLPTGLRLNRINNLIASSNEEWYYPDGDDVTTDYLKSTGTTSYAMTSTYVNGGALDFKRVRLTSDGAELYYLGDALGSVHRIIDQTEAIVNTALTTAWGEKHPGFTDVVARSDRYGFVQREVDAESGLIHMRARSYDPRIGRFQQMDPVLGYRATEHFAYCGGNPVTRTDPGGLFWWWDRFKKNWVWQPTADEPEPASSSYDFAKGYSAAKSPEALWVIGHNDWRPRKATASELQILGNSLIPGLSTQAYFSRPAEDIAEAEREDAKMVPFLVSYGLGMASLGGGAAMMAGGGLLRVAAGAYIAADSASGLAGLVDPQYDKVGSAYTTAFGDYGGVWRMGVGFGVGALGTLGPRLGRLGGPVIQEPQVLMFDRPSLGPGAASVDDPAFSSSKSGSSAPPEKGAFPANPTDLMPELPRNAKGFIYPNSYTRIRPEAHPLLPGETYSPRHHGQHYHVEGRLDPARSWSNKNNVYKVFPPGYVKGEGTGFLPGEDFPGTLVPQDDR